MKPLRYLIITAALGLATAAPVRANPFGCSGGNCGGGVPPTTLAQRLGGAFPGLQKPKLPVFQAAPWYNYWPYDAHFLTPAPISGQFYGPPMTGNFPVNPYFPGPSNVTGYGPIPGGPPPGWPVMPGPTGR